MKFSVMRMKRVCGIVTHSWCRTFILFGFQPTLRRTKTARATMNSLQSSCRQINTDIPVGNALYLDPNPTKDESRPHQLGTKMLPGIFIGYARNSGGGCTGLLIIVDWHGIEHNVASEVRVKKAKPQKLESRDCRKHSLFAQQIPNDKKFVHNIKTKRHNRVDSSDAERETTLHFGRGKG